MQRMIARGTYQLCKTFCLRENALEIICFWFLGFLQLFNILQGHRRVVLNPSLEYTYAISMSMPDLPEGNQFIKNYQVDHNTIFFT